nr:MAG TPA: hypothetical protein [Caudoviricetes sp.]
MVLPYYLISSLSTKICRIIPIATLLGLQVSHSILMCYSLIEEYFV